MPILNSISHAGLLASKGAFLGYRPFISSVSLSSSVVNEGSTLTISVNTVNVPNGTSINYSITGISINDVSSGNLTGTLNILNSQSTSNINITFFSDYLLEGDETITITFTLSQRAPYTVQATLADFSRPTFEINQEPTDTSVVHYGNTSFSVTATAINSGSGTYTYQWQRSTDSGVSWNNLTNGAVFGGCTSSQLIVEKWNAIVSTGFHNALFRCVVSDAVNLYSLTTRAATLTVTAPPTGAVILTTSGVDKTWTVPSNVYAISAVLVAAGGAGGPSSANPNYWEGYISGGGGGGGTIATGLLKVIPGETLTLRAGTGGIPSFSMTDKTGGNTEITFPASFGAGSAGSLTAVGGGGGGTNSYSSSTRPTTTLYRYGSRGARGTTSISSNITSNRTISPPLTASGGSGGLGALAIRNNSWFTSSDSRAGGGAAGYGGSGGDGSDSSASGNGTAGTNGGGGGGAGCGVTEYSTSYSTVENGGGGVGLLGPTNNGAGGTQISRAGKGGSDDGNSGSATQLYGGGLYGGGGQAGSSGRNGANGAIRIIFGYAVNTTNPRSYAAGVGTFTTSNTVIIT